MLTNQRRGLLPDGLVKAGADHKVLGGVELGAHDVVVVAGQDADALSALPVPDPHGLIVRGGQDPWILVMEHSGPDVVKMTQQGEDAASLLVIPHFDLIIISSGDKERLLFVEVHASDGTIVLVKLVKEGTHPEKPMVSIIRTQQG